ncbi:MAG: hypothetical protein Q8S73_03300 [Deltaproteobacteria bacterium]|nr:hypothetical protein [Myxococcales bacterium]MDP3213106.1 hypothetical protein [Deltaproteobacteria bacterium]
MSEYRYQVVVERWSEGEAEALSERAAQCGLDARGVRAILARMGVLDRAVEVDLCIRQVKPDVPLESIEHRFMVMTLRAAGGELQRRIDEHLGGFDRIVSNEHDVGPQDACFAFSMIELGKEVGDPYAYYPLGEVPDDFKPPSWDRARVRVWMAWELGRELRNVDNWGSGAWVPNRPGLWVNLVPAADLPMLGDHRTLHLGEMREPWSLAMADGRVLAVGEGGTEVVCHAVEASEAGWRSVPLAPSDDEEGCVAETAVSVSADGQRAYVTGGRNAGRLDLTTSAERRWVGTWPGSMCMTLREDGEGRLLEVVECDEEPPAGEPEGGALWERDRATGARARLIWRGKAWAKLPAAARRAPVVAVVLGEPGRASRALIVERGQVVRELGDLGAAVQSIALSDGGDVLYALMADDAQRSRLEAWDVATGERRWSAPLVVMTHHARELCALPGDGAVAIADAHRVALFHLGRRCEVYVADLGERLRGLTVSAEGDHLLVAGTHQPRVQVWSLTMSHRAQEGA